DRPRDPGTGLAGAERAAGLAGIVVADPDRDRDVVAEANEPGVVLLVAGAGLAAVVGRVLSDRTRGTARSIAQHAPYVGGKTGTSDEENDTWFVGFSNDVTVAVWVGYDNAGKTRRTLGSGQTGSRVARPI